MNGDRYRNYRFVLDVLQSDVFSQEERAILADSAEGMLLTTGPSGDEVEEISVQVSAALEELVASDRLRYVTAVELRARIAQCGPAGAALLPA
jgi:hypothetical protein